MNLKLKKIIVTGGGNGVGRELVFQLLEKGATVIAVDINETGLSETRQRTNNNFRLFTYRVDIANRADVENFAQTVIRELGSIDGIINNAGIIQPFLYLDDLELEQIERVMNINFYGTLYMIKALLPHLKTRPEAAILNVSSMGGFISVPGQSVYGASKAAVKLLSEGLASELRETKVKVSVVIPGGINTDIKKNSNIAHSDASNSKNAGMILTPGEAAALIIKTMEQGKLRNYIGRDSRLMCFLQRLSPISATRLINKVMHASGH